MEKLKDAAGTVLSIKHDGDTYFKGTARQRAKCCLCTEPIQPGYAAWRPLGNSTTRLRRICDRCARTA